MVGFQRIFKALSNDQPKGTARGAADGTALLISLGVAKESGVALVGVVFPRRLGSP